MLLDNDAGDKKRKDILGQNECNFINLGEEDEMEVYGYERSALSTAIMWVAIIMTLGIFRLLLHWRPEWMLYISHRRCPLEKADKVLVVDTFEKRFKSLFIREVKTLSVSGLNEGKRGNQVSVNQEVDKRCLEAHLNNGSSKVISSVQAIWVKKLCYIWDNERKSFMKLVGLDRGQTRAQLHSYNGFSKENQLLRSILYGRNEIFVQIQSIRALIILEVLNPFYIFQVFTICVWLAENYYYYCFAIIFMSLFGISSAVIQTRQNQKNLHKTVHSSGTITVCRGPNEYEEIPTTDLVPGDVIVIPSQGCVMHCDAVLLVGSCIVNESMLTGESVPVMKTALQNEPSLYNEKEDCNHTLFCGTRVLQIKYHGKGKVHAVVLRTGFLTAKGNLVRSILYPPPADYKFDSQTYKFIWILAAIALLGLIYTVVTKSSRGLHPIDILIKALDIITIVVPPSLPAAMTVGKLYALSRLKKQKISCINSRVINVSGSINCICFDKTGTLTEDGLDMWGVVPAESGHFAEPLNDTSLLSNGPLLYGMASCHSLTMINGELSGDPLDVKMMESTKWIFQEIDAPDTSSTSFIPVHAIVKPPGDSPNNNMEIALIHQFQFSSTLQRMSIVTKRGGSDDLVVYCKGSPEMIQSLSLPESVPENLPSILQSYTEQGYRVIALGERKLKDIDHSKLQTMHRNDLEKDLSFCGLIILENRLKPKTISIIDVLKKAQMKIVMVTGDNILTAVSVAKECGIISSNEAVIEVVAELEDMKAEPTISFINSMSLSVPAQASVSNGSGKQTDYELGLSMGNTLNYRLAVTGKSWEIIREMRPDLIPKLCVRGAVFARMSSDQKQQLIQDLQQLGYYVAMCGDGANDCGALKAAHTGISLSEAESSVASPFTSQIADISCVPRVIQECRAALVTSFGVFKFMVLYSLTEFLSTIILYSIDSNLTQNQFLFIDICLSLNFALSFGRNPAYSGQLVAAVPVTSVFSAIALTSITTQVVIMFAFQCLSFYVVHLYPWFTPFHYIEPTYYKCYENYAVFSLSQFQYIILAFIFSQGAPYRERIYKNKIFFSAILGMTIVCSYITLHPAEWIIDLLELEFPKQFDFPPMVLLLVGINFLFSVFFESVVVQYIMFKKLRRWRHNIDKSSKKYLAVERDLKTDRHFPLFKSCISKNGKLNVSNINETGSHNNSNNHYLPESGHVNLAFSVDEDQSRFSTKF